MLPRGRGRGCMRLRAFTRDEVTLEVRFLPEPTGTIRAPERSLVRVTQEVAAQEPRRRKPLVAEATNFVFIILTTSGSVTG